MASKYARLRASWPASVFLGFLREKPGRHGPVGLDLKFVPLVY
ncbi:MAG TPA: hypothetical protein VN829_02210 [Dongiaceae bacterium]|nr:hypothetical protein [Dongiaceae bacterium]